MRVFCLVVLLNFTFGNIIGQRAYKKNIAVANAYFTMNQYSNALEYYIRSYNNRKIDSCGLKIAQCHFQLREFEKSADWYSQYVDKNNVDNNVLKEYANVLRSTNELTKARNILLKSGVNTIEDSVFIASLDSIEKWNKEGPLSIKITNLITINSVCSEINPMYYDDGIIFSSSRENIIIKTKEGQFNQAYYDLYFAKKKLNNQWEKPSNFSVSLNTVDHNGAIALSKDQQTIYMTRGNHHQYAKESKDSTNYLKIYKSDKKGLLWDKPMRFALNDSLASFGHPAIGYNDQIFIFASDIKGGYGGTDLYITFKLENGDWKSPMNMGPIINSSKNELYPFILDNGTLYFSSNGHINFGGYDVFKTTLIEGTWSLPENLKSPINSSYDDFSFIIDTSLNEAFFSSNREGGIGSEDIYKIEFNK